MFRKMFELVIIYVHRYVPLCGVNMLKNLALDPHERYTHLTIWRVESVLMLLHR